MSRSRVNQPAGFSDRLYKAWIASDMDLTTLSQRSGIARSTLYGYMYNAIPPNVTYLAVLCEILNVSPDYLIFGKGEDPKTIRREPRRK